LDERYAGTGLIENLYPLAVLQADDRRFKRQTGPVEKGNLPFLYRIFQQMESLCVKSEGIGLSAVQVGLPWKLFVARQGETFRYMLNCEYAPVGEETARGIEGCLSLKGRFFSVDRHKEVEVTGEELVVGDDLSVREVKLHLKGLASVLFQHEIDHCFGISIDQIGKEMHLWPDS